MKREYNSLKIVRIESKYCDFLREYDNRVMINRDGKEFRPYIGVLFKIDKLLYFAPLSSPKSKHKKMRDTIDFSKINKGEYGAINFNNMIPVIDGVFEYIDLDYIPTTNKEMKYLQLLKNQVMWLNKNKTKILKKAKNLYSLYNRNLLYPNVIKRCCDFKLLEKNCTRYKKQIR